ncbi:MAG: SEC-C metal-binding domain-containing protein [Pseudomonadota bacterium]
MNRTPATASTRDLQALQQRATSFLALFEPPAPDAPDAQSDAQLRALGAGALELASALAGDTHAFALLDQRLAGAGLAERLLELPRQLADANQVDHALELARALAFIAPDLLRGDEALFLANAGRREQALALVASNLAQAKDIPTAEAKAGDVYRALGEPDAAEAYYRRALAESRSALERSQAVLRIVSLLSDTGRERDAAQFLGQERERQAERPAPSSASIARVGRNEPCPCGSGKKYKKCHGT